MNLLVDTHTFLWYARNDPRLSVRAKALLDDSNNVAFISIVSLWEIAIKDSIGKLTLSLPMDDFFRVNIDGNGLMSCR